MLSALQLLFLLTPGAASVELRSPGGDHFIHAVRAADDGGLWVLHSERVAEPASHVLWLERRDANGEQTLIVEWTATGAQVAAWALGSGLAVTSDGDVAVLVTCSGTMEGPGGPCAPSPTPNPSHLLVRLGRDGELRWSKQLPRSFEVGELAAWGDSLLLLSSVYDRNAEAYAGELRLFSRDGEPSASGAWRGAFHPNGLVARPGVGAWASGVMGGKKITAAVMAFDARLNLDWVRELEGPGESNLLTLIAPENAGGEVWAAGYFRGQVRFAGRSATAAPGRELGLLVSIGAGGVPRRFIPAAFAHDVVLRHLVGDCGSAPQVVGNFTEYLRGPDGAVSEMRSRQFVADVDVERATFAVRELAVPERLHLTGALLHGGHLVVAGDGALAGSPSRTGYLAWDALQPAPFAGGRRSSRR